MVCRTHSHRHRHIHIIISTTTQDLLTNLPCIPDNLAFAQQPGGGEAEALPQTEAGSGGGDALYVGCAAKRARPFALLDVMASLDKVGVRCT